MKNTRKQIEATIDNTIYDLFVVLLALIFLWIIAFILTSEAAKSANFISFTVGRKFAE